ncbi:F-box domain-containing protein [Coniochaeta hoffmannii]|uniref:F-box domain-containing protein n=1 Tax=Coniochaeta hoffmannii TaxID=91930 RepID=A0AA38SDN4_9PEZI|nr:F-box domain-containing protein [Coniochaeta hoffmannii]
MTVADADDVQPRSSIEKAPIIEPKDETPSAFDRLPDEIITQILQVADPNAFASLILLNSKWRRVSQCPNLYALQLSRCPSYSVSHKHVTPAAIAAVGIDTLRRLFAKEVKRNLFSAYLRPSQTVIKVINNSISSSSCPGGEGIQFASSPKGHHLLGYNSSRIYIINVTAPEIRVERELKILRRPAATCIDDAGLLLAVLLTDMQVDIYNLRESPPKRTQSIILDHSPRAIALSPCGSVLAAAYEGGIEVSSLKSTALESDRRAVKCDAVDALTFSFDGTQILGTTLHSSQPNTVILTAPYYDPGTQMGSDDITPLWTTSILFPNSSRDCSHAVLLQNGRHEEAAWTFTYDRSFETFRAVRIDDLRNGTTYFTGPIPSPTSQARLIPCTLPAASYNGELVSAGFQNKEIWVYGVPEDLDAVADCSSNNSENGNSTGLNRRNSGPSVRSPSRMGDSGDAARVPQWQILCDKLRNTFVGGFKLTELEGVSAVKWVAGFGGSSMKERLVVAARGVTPAKPITEEDGIDFVDGGRLTLIDFDYGLEDGLTTELCIEVGNKEPEVLEEETRDIDAEVALFRRRTVAQKRGGRGAGGAVIRSSTTATRSPPVPPLPSQPSSSQTAEEEDDPLVPRRIGAPPAPTRVEQSQPDIPEEAETQSIIEEQEALDAPYAHGNPRSQTTLRRAATAAAVNRRLHPPPAAAGQVEYRRADGRAEHPHESDADNWVPPPPPYQKEDPGDLPAFLRHTVRPATAAPPVPAMPAASVSGLPATLVPAQTTPPRVRQQPRSQPAAHVPLQPASAQPPLPGVGLGSSTTSRPTSRHSQAGFLDGENIYDVTPPRSPHTTAPATGAPNVGDARTVSNSSVIVQASVANVSPSSPGLSQRVLPPVPRIQTTSASPDTPRAPVLDLHIPSPTMGNFIPSLEASTSAPKPRPLSNAQTWPVKPSDPGSSAMLAAGYPYSAPPSGSNLSDRLEQALPPAPSADQLARLNNRSSHAPRRLSGGFQLQRVPVGSRASGDYGPQRQSYQHPLPQTPERQQYLLQQTQQWQQPQPTYQQPTVYHPQPRRGAPPPAEDQPLIISTPKGVTGAFDPPTRQTSSSRRSEPQILAPIPRHPRPQAQAAVLRPTVERLETIYSVASNTNGAGPLNGNNYLVAPVSNSSVRNPSVTRRQSRAERSAAKNIADAKRRGWTGRRGKGSQRGKGKGKRRERDVDAASSAAWTDVTSTSMASGFTGLFSRGDRGAAGLSREQRREREREELARGLGMEPPGTDGGGKRNKGDRGGKCVVM